MIEHTILQVENLLTEASQKTSRFAKSSGISCPAGCSNCCLNPKIEATPLEFFPAAYHLYKTGKSDALLDQLDIDNDSSICIFYGNLAEKKGNCQLYRKRGLICRLFGYAKSINKHGESTLVACKTIKQQETYKTLTSEIIQTAPQFSDLYTKLRSIEPQYAFQYLPINQAIRKALEVVSFYFSLKGKQSA